MLLYNFYTRTNNPCVCLSYRVCAAHYEYNKRRNVTKGNNTTVARTKAGTEAAAAAAGAASAAWHFYSLCKIK